jgi:hypothetical protein
MSHMMTRNRTGVKENGKGPRIAPRAFRRPRPSAVAHTVNELPQPQPPLALGLLNVKPEPWKVDT